MPFRELANIAAVEWPYKIKAKNYGNSIKCRGETGVCFNGNLKNCNNIFGCDFLNFPSGNHKFLRGQKM
jgi:hypothetical protein